MWRTRSVASSTRLSTVFSGSSDCRHTFGPGQVSGRAVRSWLGVVPGCLEGAASGWGPPLPLRTAVIPVVVDMQQFES